MSLEIWLPGSAVEGGEEGRFRCNICEKHFHDPAKWERHLSLCAQQNLDEIRANAPSVRNKGGPFDPETWDPEEESHLLRVGKRMRSEGRWEVKPHERPGAGGGGVL